MLVACCISGVSDIDIKYLNFLNKFNSVVYFNDQSANFGDAISNLSYMKNEYELVNKQKFDLCVYINSDNVILCDLQDVTTINANTLYSESHYLPGDIHVSCFGWYWAYNVSSDFFYCDSKTFNLLGTYNSFVEILKDEFKLADEIFFYSFLHNMGIKNFAINDIDESYNISNKGWIK